MHLFESHIALVGMVTVLAVISPGPDFAIIVRNGLRYGRRLGLATALGIASGVCVHTTYTLMGLSYVLAACSWAMEGIRYAGALYLIWLGISSFLPRKRETEQKCPVENIPSASFKMAFRQGFLCNVLNPKTMLFFLALFTQVISPATSLPVKIGIGIFISLTHLMWFALVVVMLTNSRTEKFRKQWQHYLERAVGMGLFVLGVKLALYA
jgi:RhtB (resistance to homoserine/threonine) family protein